jgi:uncharacterized phage-associated protein
MSTWKLQKLVYYSQAWHLVWDDEPLFDERIEAWANGPVVRELYKRHRGTFSIADWRWGVPDHLNGSEKGTIDAVLHGYGGLSGRQLSLLTHSEQPWRDARAGLDPTDIGNQPIAPDAMQAFYAALDADETAEPVDDIDWSTIESS